MHQPRASQHWARVLHPETRQEEGGAVDANLKDVQQDRMNINPSVLYTSSPEPIPSPAPLGILVLAVPSACDALPKHLASVPSCRSRVSLEVTPLEKPS